MMVTLSALPGGQRSFFLIGGRRDRRPGGEGGAAPGARPVRHAARRARAPCWPRPAFGQQPRTAETSLRAQELSSAAHDHLHELLESQPVKILIFNLRLQCKHPKLLLCDFPPTSGSKS